jgi:prolipoprotein diacylglyceryltransferase
MKLKGVIVIGRWGNLVNVGLFGKKKKKKKTCKAKSTHANGHGLADLQRVTPLAKCLWWTRRCVAMEPASKGKSHLINLHVAGSPKQLNRVLATGYFVLCKRFLVRNYSLNYGG